MKFLGLVLLCWCVATAALASDGKGTIVGKPGRQGVKGTIHKPSPTVSTQKVENKATGEPVLIRIRDWDAVGCADPDQIFVIRMFRTTREIKATCE